MLEEEEDEQHSQEPLSRPSLIRTLSFLHFQGSILFKDGSRAVLQYSVPRGGEASAQGPDGAVSAGGPPAKVLRDWICAKVN